ncbi:MAG: FAD-dependent oxidoreductase [Aggregatilineales bacterium]
MSNESFPVVIIGAGLAGLSAGLHLSERGIAPLILEEDSYFPGGRLAGGWQDTFEYDGETWSFMSEHGIHAVWGAYVNMRAMLARLEINLQPSPGEEWINRWGREVRRIEAGNTIRSRWIPAPFHYLQLLFHPHIWATISPWDFLSLPGLLASIFLTIGFDPMREKRALDGLLMSEYFRGWTPNLKATFRGVGVNLLAAPEEDIDLTAFIAALRFYTMLRRDAWRMDYLPGDSHSALIQPMIDRIHEQGGELRCGMAVKQLARDGDGWRVRVFDDEKGALRTIRAEQVIMATHAPGAKRLLLNSPDLRTDAEKIIFPEAVRCSVVRLWFDVSPREGTPGGMLTGDFAPDNFFWLHRLYDEFHDWHKSSGGSAIELHFYATDKILNLNDSNLLVLATTEVQRAFPKLRGHFVYGVVRRNSKVHTRFRVPTDESLHVKTPWSNLYACGDWIGHDTPSMWMERATTTGIAAANHILEKTGYNPHPILYPPPPERPARLLSALLMILRRIFALPVRLLFRRRR